MKKKRSTFLFQICLSLLLITSIYAAPEDPYPFTSQSDATRFTALTKEIRCIVCQNQNLADSNAPIASDLRLKIYGMVLNHQSDAAIKDYLVKRYGEFILLEPRVNKVTFLLWVFPLLGLIGVIFLLYRAFKIAPPAVNSL